MAIRRKGIQMCSLDMYDGEIWKEFLQRDGVPFLSVPNNFALQLNVDWFKPFKHTQHSEGAI